MGLTVLDARVVIAGLDGDDAHHAAAADALRDARDRDDSLVVPASACAEALVRPGSRRASTVARVDAALDALGVTIAATDREIARRAATLRSRYRGLQLPDALVIATAVELDADHLLTTDRRWKRLRGLGLRGRLTVVG